MKDMAGAMFTLVTDGIESALAQAKAAAGDKNVGVMDANIDQQYMRVGLLTKYIFTSCPSSSVTESAWSSI